jgi:hypothetical protein
MMPFLKLISAHGFNIHSTIPMPAVGQTHWTLFFSVVLELKVFSQVNEYPDYWEWGKGESPLNTTHEKMHLVPLIYYLQLNILCPHILWANA